MLPKTFISFLFFCTCASLKTKKIKENIVNFQIYIYRYYNNYCAYEKLKKKIKMKKKIYKKYLVRFAYCANIY